MSQPQSLMRGAWNYFDSGAPTYGMSFQPYGGVNSYLGTNPYTQQPAPTNFGQQNLNPVTRDDVDQWLAQPPAPQPEPEPEPAAPPPPNYYQQASQNVQATGMMNAWSALESQHQGYWNNHGF